MVTKLGPDSGSPVMQYDGDQKDRDQKPLQEVNNGEANPGKKKNETHIGLFFLMNRSVSICVFTTCYQQKGNNLEQNISGDPYFLTTSHADHSAR